jgi:AraC-like DNA-binding protein
MLSGPSASQSPQPNPGTTNLPFLRLPGSSLAPEQVDAFASLIGQSLPMHVLAWDMGPESEAFYNKSGAVSLGDLNILSTWGSSIDGLVEQKSQAQWILPYLAGTNSFAIEDKTYIFRESSLYIPAHQLRMHLHCSLCSGVIFSFNPDGLVPVAAAIAGPAFDSISFMAVLEQPAILERRSDERRQHLHELLMQTLALIDSAMQALGDVNQMMRLDDLIKRLMVMLLVPDLFEIGSPPSPSLASSSGFPHGDLIDWVMANLDQPISLTDMEQRSCYSRRSLQYTFKQHYGCGPMQWLRQQRLEKAMRLLQESGGQLGLSQVAQSCGYISQSSFSRDFLKRFGQRPSKVRRLNRVL